MKPLRFGDAGERLAVADKLGTLLHGPDSPNTPTDLRRLWTLDGPTEECRALCLKVMDPRAATSYVERVLVYFVVVVVWQRPDMLLPAAFVLVPGHHPSWKSVPLEALVNLPLECRKAIGTLLAADDIAAWLAEPLTAPAPPAAP